MPGDNYKCSKCGKPTRSHVFFSGRLVFCHVHWEALTPEERDDIRKKDAEYRKKVVTRGIVMAMMNKNKEKKVILSENVTLIER